MITILPNETLSINDLLALKNAGIPVTLTSHPGNASLYKLSLWACGIPEHLWDVTCLKADKNNWPKHKLINGTAQPLLSDELSLYIDEATHTSHRMVTAYTTSRSGEFVGRRHVRAIEECFPSHVSSCSQLLLSEEQNVYSLFDFLAHTCPEKVFTRYITPTGVMIPLIASSCGNYFKATWKQQEVTMKISIHKSKLASSFVEFLKELDALLFSDNLDKTTLSGGVCYDGAMVSLSDMLVSFWRTGETHRYDISGPDMIHYATRIDHQKSLSEMLEHLCGWSSSLVPKNITVHMPLGTVARIGYVKGHISEEVMIRRLRVARDLPEISSDEKRALRNAGADDEMVWPSQINPLEKPYFSQYDLAALGYTITVDEFWKDIPLGKLKDIFSRIKNQLQFKK